MAGVSVGEGSTPPTPPNASALMAGHQNEREEGKHEAVSQVLAANAEPVNELAVQVRYEPYVREEQMGLIVALIEKDLSEPYSIFTYR